VIIRSYEKNDFIHIEVVDQGIGLTTEEINQLFTKFYRAKNDHTTKITGTGLGLYLTKYFIEAHRGKLTVESQKNHGSTFRISLPLFNVTDSITLTRGEHYV
jgi:signal transduction histidine kinase